MRGLKLWQLMGIVLCLPIFVAWWWASRNSESIANDGV